MNMPPLLVLAEGRKPRARKALVPAPKESVLHYSVANLLNAHCLSSWDWSHFPSGELRDVRTATKLKRFGVQKGWPDFILISPHGLVNFLELKRPGGKLTREQETFRVRCVRRGIPYVVAETIDQVLAAFDTWGCLRIVPTRRETKVIGARP